jgi:RNA polymerase-binding protein DksA
MLTKQQIEQFRKRLEEERQSLLSRLDDASEQLAESDQMEDGGNDTTDEASTLYEREMRVEEVRQRRARLALLEHALRRIEAGSYGLSELSGKPIPIERLEALPWATTLADEPTPTP